MTIIRFPVERTRKPSSYLQAMMELARSMDSCLAVSEAINEKLRKLPGRVVLWDEDRKPCDQ